MGSAKTSFQFSTSAWTAAEADGLVIPVIKPESGLEWTGALAALDQATGGLLKRAAELEEFEAASGKILTVLALPEKAIPARAIVLLGLGCATKLRAGKLEQGLRKAVKALASLKDFKTLAIALPPTAERLSPHQAVQAVVDAVAQATYRSAESLKPGPALSKVLLLAETAASSELESALLVGATLAQARSFAKDLVNRPSNLKTTETMADAARALEGLEGISVRIEQDIDWIRREMPAFYAVAQGSLTTDPPRFIAVSYTPAGGAQKKLALVGKTVIFDTGGYQVKPGDSMLTMKGDMTGGAMALATLQALAALKPKHIAVTAYLAATPNKIDSDAMLPDSILSSTCGKKLEIRHTDAEGRLTLIDAVAKAVADGAEEVVTVATLTGSAMRAVGMCVALMAKTEHESLRDRIQAAAKAQDEPFQTLDLFEEDEDDIKSKLDGADLINTSKNKNRGAQSAACFVIAGASGKVPVAHLDIAGADMTGDEKATGIGQKTLIQFFLDEDRRLSKE